MVNNIYPIISASKLNYIKYNLPEKVDSKSVSTNLNYNYASHNSFNKYLVNFGSYRPLYELKYGNISKNQAQHIAEILNKPQTKMLIEGWAGKCYKLKLKNGETVVIKIPKEGKQQELEKEAQMLDKIKNISNTQKLKAYFLLNNTPYLITKFIEGQNIYDLLMKNNQTLKSSNMHNIVNTLCELDKKEIFNSDLHEGNIIINGDKITILDFGDSIVVTPEKLKKEITGKNLLEMSKNPYIQMLSNLECFETRTLAPYLIKIKHKKGDEEIYKQLTAYLQASSKYHSKMANYIKTKLNLCSDKNKSEYLKKAVHYENTLAKIYANPNNKVLNIELSKILLKHIAKELEFAVNSLKNGNKYSNDIERLKNKVKIDENIKIIVKNILNSLEKVNKKSYVDVNKKYVLNLKKKIAKMENPLSSETLSDTQKASEHKYNETNTEGILFKTTELLGNNYTQ